MAKQQVKRTKPKKPAPRPAAKPSKAPAPKPGKKAAKPVAKAVAKAVPKPMAKPAPKAKQAPAQEPTSAAAGKAKQVPAMPAPATKAAGKPAAKPAAAPVVKPAPKPAIRPIVLPPAPAVEAPAKFRREYRKWKDVLISLRHRLLSEGSHLEEEGLKALEQEVSVDHMADFGSDSSEQETTLQLIENNSLSLRDVDDALKRIEAKRYGLCEDCEALIPAARLEVLPHARLCIDCQSKREGNPG